MKYEINNRSELIIRNELGNQIFGISKNNNWIKRDYNHKGYIISYENHTGYIMKY